MSEDLYTTIARLKKDPNIAAALQRGDLAALQNDPNIIKALRQLDTAQDPEQAEKLAKKLMSTAGGEQLKKMLGI